jgi:cytoskeletal protein CcmA (bactofilin family)
LRSENLLFSLLLGKQEAAQPAAAKSGGWAWIVASLAGMAIVWQAASSWFRNLETPAVVEWLNPSGGDVVWNLAFSALFSSGEWQSALTGIITGASLAAVAGGVVLAGWFVRRWAPSSALAAVSLVLAFLMVAPVEAIDRRKGNVVTVASGETVNDTLVAMAEEVEISGNVNGDVIAFARRVSVRGNVAGNLIGFGRDIEIKGKVQGSIYNFAQSMRLEGEAERNLIAFVEKLDLQSEGQVRYDVIAFAKRVTLSGAIGRDAAAFTEEASVGGQVGRNLKTYSKKVLVRPDARINGDFTATVPRQDYAKIESGAVIGGESDIRVHREKNRYARPGFYLWSVITLIGAWIVGLLIATFFPGAFAFASGTTSEIGWKAGIGFLVVVVTPVAAIILCLTLIGLPLGLITLVLWLLLLYLSKIFVGAAIAQAMFKPANTGPRAMALPLLASLALIWIVTAIPIAGKLFGFLIAITGAGMVFTWWRSRIAPPRPAVTA